MEDDDIPDYMELCKIGKGNGSNVVYKVKNLSNNKIFALKKIVYDKNNKNEITRNLNEIKIFKEMDHPHIIKYYDSFVNNEYLFIVMEYAAGGDLQHEVKKHIELNQLIPEKQVRIKYKYYIFQFRFGGGF
jgi:serine/threonine protein kinase